MKTLSDLLKIDLVTLQYSDIVEFLQTKESEGIHLDYKREINAKSLKKHFAAFSNKYGGIIIIGVDEDFDLQNQSGIELSEKDVETIHQIASQIDPLPTYQVKLVKLSEKNGFIVIKIAQGLNTPYFVINDPSVYVRTGNITKRYLEIASQEELKTLFGRSEASKLFHKNVKCFVKKVFNSHIEQGEIERKQKLQTGKQTIDFPLGNNCVFVESLIIPAIYSEKELVDSYCLKRLLIYEKPYWRNTTFPDSHIQMISIPGGLSGFYWSDSSGAIENLQTYCNGSIYYNADVLENNGQEEKFIFLSRIWFYAMLSLKLAEHLYKKTGYLGQITWIVSLHNIKGIPIKGVGYNHEMKRALLNDYEITLQTNSNEIFNGDADFNLFKKLMWNFGYDFENISEAYQNFLKNSR